MEIPKNKEYLFFKNGKAKKSYCACLTWYPKELYRIYGRYIEQCAGLRCPFYSVGCGKYNIKKWKEREKEKGGNK